MPFPLATMIWRSLSSGSSKCRKYERLCYNYKKSDTDCRYSIVAVPGIGAAASQPWLDGQVNWLKDDTMLPYWLPTARIMQASYDWECLDQGNPIQNWLPLLARELLRTVLAKRRTCSTRPLIFIGHSFGGLIIKKVS